MTTHRVKDLAAELGVSTKEIIQRLREMGIQAKSQMSSLEDEDAAKLRAEFKTDAANADVTRREVQPGVIVRRRKPRRAKAGDAEEPAVEEAVAEDIVEEIAVEAPEADKKNVAPVAEETADTASEAKTAPKRSGRKAESLVKVIRPAQAEAEEAASEEAPAETESLATEAPATEAAAESAPPAESAAAPTEAEKTEEAETVAQSAEEAEKTEKATELDEPATEPAGEVETEAAEEEGTAKKKKKKAKKEPATPQVRIISRPDPSQAPAPRETPSRPAPARRPGPGGPGGPRPGGPRPGGPRPGAPAAADGPVPPTDGDSRKKRGKGRRVVEFSPYSDGDGRKRGGKGKGGPDESRDFRPGKGGRRKKQRSDAAMDQGHTQPLKAAKRKIRFDEAIRVSDLAHQMGIKAQEIIKALFGLGVMATINQSLDYDTAQLIAVEFGYELENVSFDEQEFLIPTETDKPEDLKGRPPVVTIMGHVDHGKTSLLDAIRSSNVTEGEAGGITQHIGAYHVTTERGEIVFLDTPGHEAFTTMRMRGAQVTDIVILVVAADDGVMDQTREAISHAKAAGVPIVVAVNKIDKPNANPDNVMRELAEFNLVPEAWGGDTIFASVSAKQRIGLDELLEMVLLQAEVLELKANPDKAGRGHIVEAKLDKGRGPVGTVLINEGTISQGDSFVCGVFAGKVRALFNDQGKKIKSAGPAIPVEVQGFDGVPEAGDEFAIVADEKVARRIAQTRLTKQREKELAGKSKVTLESFLASRPDQEAQVLNLIVKADVQGSLEAVSEALNKLSGDEVRIDIVHGGAGAITESDILLASASQAIVIGFNVRPTVQIKDIAEREGVEVRFYDIIYKLVSEVKDAMSGMLAPDIEEVYLGQAEVRDTFSVPKVGMVAGCFVVDGKLTRNAQIRLLRDGVVIYTGSLDSLRRFKDDVKEVAKGYECGVGLAKFNDIKVGDFIEAFETREVARTLD